MEQDDAPPKRRNWPRAIAAGVALGLAGALAGNLLFPDRSPELLDGLDGDHAKAGTDLTTRVRARFPAGTPETAITSALADDGFKIDPAARTASWERRNLPCTDIARIWWTVEQGKVANVQGLRNAICP